MKPWTLPVVLAVAVCFGLLNTAGYPSCPHMSAPSPESVFGWPRTYLRVELTPSQWEQVRVDGRCACGKPITARELPLQVGELSRVDSNAVLWNVGFAVILFSYFAFVTELAQRRWRFKRPFTVRAALMLTASIAIFASQSRSGYLYINVLQYLFYSPLIKLATVLAALALVIYLVARRPQEIAAT